jgi:curved DNA-binding protein CbpA
MKSPATADPFLVLGLPRDAGEAEVRARYLELVKQFPPDREPEKFREIRSAFEACKDPLSIARRLIRPPDDDEVPEWSDAIEAQKRNPPRLSPAFLLSLGNRSPDDLRSTTAGAAEPVSKGGTNGHLEQSRTDAP